ncbi:MAG TPA: sulfatase-like hydrolase/transferase [Pirellulales bacterium]|jgi:arylsulfatase A-like enzyme|nr:sulfatase-like hydrolase/transferase [Pirellulales bacterium]
MAEVRNVICLVIDGLQPAFLGAYGNTWIATPGLDRLAAESFVCDTALTDTLDLARIYRGFWQGLPAIWPDSAAADSPPLIDRANQAGWQTALLTDDRQVAELPAAAAFSQRTLLAVDEPSQPATDVDETATVRFLAEASRGLNEARQPFFLWMHARGLFSPWDAPYPLRAQYADEEDPAPPAWLAPEWQELAGEIDPDELLGLMHAYAGQVSLWDAGLGTWLDEFRAHPAARNTLLVFLSPRGYPLAEHRQIGRIVPDLYSESVQLAWWWRFPDGLGAPARTSALALPADLSPTIAQWLDWPAARPTGGHSLLPLARWEQSAVREAAVLTAGTDRWALRTPAWHLIASGADDAQKVELYAKPGDRYEVNDVAIRAPEIAAGLSQQLQRARSSATEELTGLDPALVTVVD